MATLLPVPTYLQGEYSTTYAPTIAELQALSAGLSGEYVFINQAAEGFSADYLSPVSVANLVNTGHYYADYCGWPMWYYGRTGQQYTLFGKFLTDLGADPAYVKSFDNSGCTTYPYDRGWLTPGLDLTSPASQIYGSAKYACPTGDIMYGMVAVKSLSSGGIYFYGAHGSNGGVDPATYAQFIKNTIHGVATTPPTTPPTGGPSSEQQCLASGGHWIGGQCIICTGNTYYDPTAQQCLQTPPTVPPSTPPTSPGKVNWPVIIGGGVVALGLFTVLVAYTKK